MTNLKLRAWDHFNEHMVYSSEEDASFHLENGKWNVQYVREKNFNNDGIEIDAPVWHESGEIEVMVFSGTTDKNGTEIYEGDKCRIGSVPGIVSYSEQLCKYFFSGDGFSTSLGTLWPEGIEVIGNIYEKTEILTEQI